MSIIETKNKKLQQALKDLPKLPGVYIYKNAEDEIIYVGKAKNLFNRVRSYFLNFDRLELKRQNLVTNIESLETITVDSEVEALILENNLIKKYLPKYNVLMRDDKSYIYVRFEKVRKKNMPIPTKYSVYQDFPRITIIRNKKDDGADYFGPYPDSLPAKTILRRLRKVFPYRTDNELVYIDYEQNKIITPNKKPDLYYHLGLDMGTTLGFEKKEEYVKRFREIKKFFEGRKSSTIRKLEGEMQELSKNMKFEEAAKLRDQINNIKYVTANIKIDNDVDDISIADIQAKDQKSATNNLIAKLGFPSDKLKNHPNFRIECYDISNTQGTNAVGAMTVVIDGKLQPSLYRKFKIRMKNEPNDFAMHQEVLTRRFRNLIIDRDLEEIPDELIKKANKWKPDPSFSQIPDLIIIDGGKGQLASTYKILYQFNLHNTIPIVGLAKREEEIFKITDQFKDEFTNQINDSKMFTKVMIPRKSAELHLVQRLRDEAHRFGITYHRKLRSKKFLKS